MSCRVKLCHVMLSYVTLCCNNQDLWKFFDRLEYGSFTNHSDILKTKIIEIKIRLHTKALQTNIKMKLNSIKHSFWRLSVTQLKNKFFVSFKS